MFPARQPSGSAAQDGGGASALSETLGGRPQANEEAAWRDNGFIWTLLPRHGKRPALFLGREMLRADSRMAGLSERFPYWSDIQIFEIFTGGFVTAVRHIQAEDDRVLWQDTWFSAAPGGVVLSLRNHGSAGMWPDTAQGEDVGARLGAWLALVRALFGEARCA